MCGPKLQNITISYKTNVTHLNLTFNFVMNDQNKYHMDKFSLSAKFDSISLNGWFENFPQMV